MEAAMGKRQEPRDRLELETMLLSRYLLPNRRYSGERTRHLERSAYTLLSRVVAEGPMSLSELSEALGLDVSTLNRQTSAMTKTGNLERVSDPAGGMARKFQATKVGRERLEADRKANVDGLGVVTASWSDEEIDAFVGMLRRLNADLEDIDGRPWPRD
jgi:DNA-binding MarR family transcriptional regulator